MTGEQLKAAAAELYKERQEKAAHFGWKNERAGFVRRVRNLAKKVSCKAVYPDPQAQALMYLDVIATREGFELKYKEEL